MDSLTIASIWQMEFHLCNSVVVWKVREFFFILFYHKIEWMKDFYFHMNTDLIFLCDSEPHFSVDVYNEQRFDYNRQMEMIQFGLSATFVDWMTDFT